MLAAVKEWQLEMYGYYVQSPTQTERSRTISRLVREEPDAVVALGRVMFERQNLLAELMIDQHPQLDPFVLEMAGADRRRGAGRAVAIAGGSGRGMAKDELLSRAAARSEQVYEIWRGGWPRCCRARFWLARGFLGPLGLRAARLLGLGPLGLARTARLAPISEAAGTAAP